jgi:hypothetical protein
LVTVNLDIGHVKGFVEVSFPRASHWSKGKVLMEKFSNNGRLERRPYLVKLKRIEFLRGKRFGQRRVLGRSNHHMRFKMISSRRVEREHPLGGITYQSFVRVQRGFKILLGNDAKML